jgi:hypothetical protein
MMEDEKGEDDDHRPNEVPSPRRSPNAPKSDAEKIGYGNGMNRRSKGKERETSKSSNTESS